MEKYLPLAGAIALPLAGGAVGAYFVRKNVDTWYEGLKKPAFRPPNWYFGPVWTTLYTGIGTASYLVWKDGGGFNGDAKLPLMLYGSNLALNFLWSPIFFGAHQKGLAFVDILLLWGTTGACTVTFYSVNKTASYLMMPYWGWISFASVLSYCIWRDNKDSNEKDEKKNE